MTPAAGAARTRRDHGVRNRVPEAPSGTGTDGQGGCGAAGSPAPSAPACGVPCASRPRPGTTGCRWFRRRSRTWSWPSTGRRHLQRLPAHPVGV